MKEILKQFLSKFGYYAKHDTVVDNSLLKCEK